jgi:hypothetical protein
MAEGPLLKSEVRRPIRGHMRISDSTAPLSPAASHARSTGRSEAGAPPEAPAPPAPIEVPETSETGAPAETGKAHGLIRATEHSHRSDVAALRQWINHPDLRSDLPLPDPSAEHKGNGFQQAVAAYEAIIAIGNPSTDPARVPEPVVSDPAPVVSDPAPIAPGFRGDALGPLR